MSLRFPDDPLSSLPLLATCEALAERLDIRLVREPMASMGGLCRVRDQWRLYLRPDLTPDEILDTFARAFARFDLGNQYIAPALRDAIDRARNEPGEP